MNAKPRGPSGGIRALKFELWPDIDRAAWNAAVRPGDLLDPAGPAASWALATTNNAMSAYGRWLTWLGDQQLLDALVAPADRVTSASINAYVATLRQRSASTTIVAYVAFLGCSLRVMAPEHDWSWLSRIIAGLKRLAKPAHDKQAELQHSGDLVALGLNLMDTSDSEAAVTTWQQATQYRDGLMIALLAFCPVRRRNFCAIQIDKHLVAVGDTYRLSFDRTETKTKRPIAFMLPPVLLPYLERYLAHFRPWLLRQTSNRNPAYLFREPGMSLWVSKTGSALASITFYNRLVERTADEFGRPVSPHRFRDCAATTTAIELPEQVYITAGLLGHGSLKMSERYYNHAHSVEAMRRLGAQVGALRRRARQKRRRGNADIIQPEA
jgi:integrase/recombinase XerD